MLVDAETGRFPFAHETIVQRAILPDQERLDVDRHRLAVTLDRQVLPDAAFDDLFGQLQHALAGHDPDAADRYRLAWRAHLRQLTAVRRACDPAAIHEHMALAALYAQRHYNVISRHTATDAVVEVHRIARLENAARSHASELGVLSRQLDRWDFDRRGGRARLPARLELALFSGASELPIAQRDGHGDARDRRERRPQIAAPIRTGHC